MEGYNLSDVADWEWRDFIRARNGDDKSEYEDAILELIYSIANEKTSLSAIKKSIERVDGKQPENIKTEYPKFYMRYPYAKNIDKLVGDGVAIIDAPEIKMPAPEMATAGIRGAIADVSSRPKGSALKLLEAARRFIEDPAYVSRVSIKVKEVVASALIVLSKTKQQAMEELLNQIDGKVAVTYKLLGDDVYLTDYGDTAPIGGFLDKDGIYVIESKNVTDAWAAKLGEAMGANFGCDGKVKYRTYSEAKRKVRQMKRNPHIDKAHQSLSFYRCRDCHFYHIGNSNRLDRIKRNHYKGRQYDRRSKPTVEDN